MRGGTEGAGDEGRGVGWEVGGAAGGADTEAGSLESAGAASEGEGGQGWDDEIDAEVAGAGGGGVGAFASASPERAEAGAGAVAPAQVREGVRRRVFEVERQRGGSGVVAASFGSVSDAGDTDSIYTGGGVSGAAQRGSEVAGGGAGSGEATVSIFGRMLERAEERANAAATANARRVSGGRERECAGGESRHGGAGASTSSSEVGRAAAAPRAAVAPAFGANDDAATSAATSDLLASGFSMFGGMMQVAEERRAAAASAAAVDAPVGAPSCLGSRFRNQEAADGEEDAVAPDAEFTPPPTPPPMPDWGGQVEEEEDEEEFRPLPVTRWRMAMGTWCTLEEWAQHRMVRGRALSGVGRLNDSLVSVYCLARYLAVAGL